MNFLKNLNFYLVSVIFLFSADTCRALEPAHSISQYLYENWQISDGLPQNTVTSFAQTQDGYLWFGTLEGLVRFDGVKFTIFNTKNLPALKHNMIVSLFVDSNNRLWCATSGGGLLVNDHGKYTVYTNKDGLPDNQVSIIYEDRFKNIWVGTETSGLSQLIAKTFQPVATTSQNIYALLETNEGLWVGGEKGLQLLKHRGGTTNYDHQNGLPSDSVRSLLLDSQKNLWIGTDGGIGLLSNGKIQALNSNCGAPNKAVQSMIKDRDQNIWIATDGDGIFRFNRSGFKRITNAQQLADNSILSLYEDREGNLWYGTNTKGLGRISDSHFITFGETEGLSLNTTRSIIEDSDGNIWVGTEGRGINHLQGQRFKSFSKSSELASSKILTQLQDSQGQFWFGTEQGLVLVNQNGSQRFTIEDGLASNTITALYEDRQQNLWIGTYAGGLHLKQDNRFEQVDILPAANEITINTILEDANRTLWIGTRGQGLIQWQNGQTKHYTTKNGLSDNLVFSLYLDEQSQLWVGTYGGGLNRFDGEQFSVIREENGLFDDVVHHIVEDQFGYFWMSSNRGISRVKNSDLNQFADGVTATFTNQSFGIEDGMRSRECNGGPNSGLRDSKGYIWFPTVEGIVRIDPALSQDKFYPLTILIENLLLDGTPSLLSSNNQIEDKVKSIEIQFTATALTFPNRIRFRYQLVGLDDDWVETGNRRAAYFSKLPAGDYKFRINASDYNGEWSDKITQISFTVAPRLIETLWFRITILISVALFVLLFHRLRVRRLTRYNQELEQMVSERTAELEAANRQLTKLANEDGLTGALNRRAFDQVLDEECRRADRAHAPISLLLVDIDYFKPYNDILGHQAGDECIQRVSQLLTAACVRAGESVFRYGGDELAVILPATKLAEAITQGNNLCRAIEAAKIPHQGSKVSEFVTLSIGVASSENSEKISPAELIKNADHALYSAKASGRNRATTVDD